MRSTSSAYPTGTGLRLEACGVESLRRFCRWQSSLHDFTLPFLLFGRSDLLASLRLAPDDVALDVGCGTGWALERLARRGANVRGIDCSRSMLARARAKARRMGWTGLRISFDSRPFGTHVDYDATADTVLFSYSLSMVPPFAQALASARAALRPGGRVAVVDFLDAKYELVTRWLTGNHVHLGHARLDRLRALFPRHRLQVRHTPLWSYFLFWGKTD